MADQSPHAKELPDPHNTWRCNDCGATAQNAEDIIHIYSCSTKKIHQEIRTDVTGDYRIVPRALLERALNIIKEGCDTGQQILSSEAVAVERELEAVLKIEKDKLSAGGEPHGKRPDNSRSTENARR